MKVESKEELENYLEVLVNRAKNDVTKVHIEYKGRVIKVESGKKVWSSIGAAKNAIRYNLHGKKYLDWIKEIEDSGDLKYIVS